MGYRIWTSDSNFKIMASDVPAAYEAIQKIEAPYEAQIEHFTYFPLTVKFVVILEKLFGFSTIITDDFTITDIKYIWEKSTGVETKLMEALAPFVVSGSYIEMHGESGGQWRYVFKDGKFETKLPKIIWE